MNTAILDRFPQFDGTLLVLMKHGSHLYGTDTPDSDMDIKGVFMPSPRSICLGKIPKSLQWSSKKDSDRKNMSGDMDIQLFSLHYFIEMACKGETISVDMLHATQAQCLMWTPVWQDLFANRSRFYTKNMAAFIGYARTQAAKYGIKGSRLDAVKQVVDFLFGKIPCDTDKETYENRGKKKLKDIWNQLPTGEHIHFLEPNPRDKNGNRIYQVCGKQFLENTPLIDAHLCLFRFYDEYGKRARLAQENKGIDWKAISHAFRAAFQMQSIFETGDLKFPLPQAEFLRQVKLGEFGDNWGYIQTRLENEIGYVEKLSEQSSLPTVVDTEAIYRWLFYYTFLSFSNNFSFL